MGRPPPAGFLPSRDGFAFTNSWPPAPAVTVPTPFGRIGIGNAARGLCGGMVFAALDYWHARTPPPASRPAPGARLYRFIVRRLIESWHMPAGVARYYRWMNSRGLSRHTIEQEWPRVRASIDRGQPAVLGVVTVASANPAMLGHNHQVLACGYRLTGTGVTIEVYDPNSGQNDGVHIQFDTEAPATAIFAHNINIGWPVRGFFLTGYSPVVPPAG